MRGKNFDKCFFLASASTDESNRTISLTVAVVNVCFSILSVLLNGGIILVIARNRQLCTKYNFFVLNLCIACLFTGALTQTVVGLFHFQVYLQPCYIFKMIGKMLTLSSYLSLCAVSFERYIKIFHPLHCQQCLTPKAITISCLSCWMISVVVTLIYYFSAEPDSVGEKLFRAVLYIAGFIWINFVNIKTILVVRRIQKDIQNQQNLTSVSRRNTKKNVRAVLFTTVIITSFIISYLPYCILSFSLISYPDFSWYSVSIVISLACFNASVTPIFVIWFHGQIRRQLFNCLRCNSDSGSRDH